MSLSRPSCRVQVALIVAAQRREVAEMHSLPDLGPDVTVDKCGMM